MEKQFADELAALKAKFVDDLAAAAAEAAARLAALEKAHADEVARLTAAWQAEKDDLLAEIERLKALLAQQRQELLDAAAAEKARLEQMMADAAAAAKARMQAMADAFAKEKEELAAKHAAEVARLMDRIKELEAMLAALRSELDESSKMGAYYDKVRVELTAALQLPIGKTVARIDQIINELGEYQKEFDAAKAARKTF